MYEHVIQKSDLELLERLPVEICSSFYLAGGTALALQIGHRYSYDFDFFTDEQFNNEILKQKLRFFGNLTLFQDSRDTLEVLLNTLARQSRNLLKWIFKICRL